MLNSEETAATVLRRHKEQTFTRTFEPGGERVQMNLQPDREKWLRKLLTLQWLVLDFLRLLPNVENASMTKYRIGEGRSVRIYAKGEGQDTLREVGVAECREVNEDGPEPDAC